MLIAIIVLYVKFEFVLAFVVSLFIIILSYLEYKHPKAEADTFIKNSNMDI